MCGIAISLDKATFIASLTQNEISRGGFAHSVMTLSRYAGMVDVQNLSVGLGKFDPLYVRDADVYVGHTQAPTGGLMQSFNRMHPAVAGDVYLYHNGILKSRYLKENDWSGRWDTELLLSKFMSGRLDEVDGSFACVVVDDNVGTVSLFRNDTAPLYITDRLDVSSIPHTSDYKMIDAGVIWRIDFATRQLVADGTFNNNDKFFIK